MTKLGLNIAVFSLVSVIDFSGPWVYNIHIPATLDAAIVLAAASTYSRSRHSLLFLG